MTRSTARWTITAAVAALLAVPAAGSAQTPQTPPPTQETPAPSEPAGQSPAPASAQPTEPQSAPPAGSQVDTQEVKRHLTAARDSLSQLTQLPAAAQLSGDARRQVAELITNFNELITTNTEWRASYAKVEASLTSLLSSETAAPSQPPTPGAESPSPTPTPGAQPPTAPGQPPAGGAAGAVGTSGTANLDPAIRAKLEEFRTHLNAFEKAASTATSAAAAPSADPQAQPPAPSSAPTTASQPTPSTPTASSAPSGTPGAVGTSGSTPATPGAASSPSSPASAEPKEPQQDAAAGHQDAMQHIEAIESLLGGSSLNQAQIEQVKTHLAELKKALNQSGK